MRQTTVPTVGIAQREGLLPSERVIRFPVLLLGQTHHQRDSRIENLPLLDGSHRLLLERMPQLQLFS